MRVLVFALLAVVAHGQSLDDAVRTLAKDIQAQLAANETAHLTDRNPDPASAAETARARTLLDRALRRPQARGAAVVEVVVTATENVRGPLLVAEIQRGSDTMIETAAYSLQPAAAATRLTLSSRKLWEQEEPILDLAPFGDGFAVLSPAGIKVCPAGGGACEVKQSHAAAPLRDPRGRLQVSGDAFAAYFPDDAAAEFQMDGEQVHFLTAQNALESAGGERFYSVARSGSFRLVAALDGRVHVSQGPRQFVLEGWGSDVVGMAGACASGALVVASSSSEGDAPDAVTAYEITSQNAHAVSEPVKFAGPVTALWPTAGGALAVVRQAERYAAYSLTLDCSR
jgi:hypothetical protein